MNADGYKKFLIMLVGTFLLISGVTIILYWWLEVVILFRGLIGIILAIAGLVILYFLTTQK